MIEKIGTPARYMEIPPDRIECVPILCRRISSLVSPMATTPSRMRFAIIFKVMLICEGQKRQVGPWSFLYMKGFLRLSTPELMGHKMGSDVCY